MSDRGFIGKMLFVNAGLLAWAAHFTIIYAVTTLACTKNFAGRKILGLGIVPFAITIATLAALAVIGAVLINALVRALPPRSARSGEDSARFLRYVTVSIALLALVAIVWNALPVLVLPPC